MADSPAPLSSSPPSASITPPPPSAVGTGPTSGTVSKAAPPPPVMHGEIWVARVAKLRADLETLLAGNTIVEPVTPVVVGSTGVPIVVVPPPGTTPAPTPAPAPVNAKDGPGPVPFVGVVVGPLYHFDMAFDVVDMQSGLVMTAARPHRTDVGEELIMRSAQSIINSIILARAQAIKMQS